MISETLTAKIKIDLFIGLFLCVVVGNIFLIKQNRELRIVISKYRPNLLESGDILTPFVAQGLQGAIFNIEYAGNQRNRVFIFFSPNCGYSRQQFPLWRETIKRADKTNYEIIGLVSNTENINSVNEYLKSIDCADLPVAVVSAEDQKKYKLSQTPLTIVVNNKGEVVHNWVGIWDANQTSSVGATLGITFSGKLS